MDGIKNALASKSVWGGILMIVSTGLQLAGIDIGDTGPWVEQIMGLVGAIVAIYGRIVAVKKIG